RGAAAVQLGEARRIACEQVLGDEPLLILEGAHGRGVVDQRELARDRGVAVGGRGPERIEPDGAHDAAGERRAEGSQRQPDRELVGTPVSESRSVSPNEPHRREHSERTCDRRAFSARRGVKGSDRARGGRAKTYRSGRRTFRGPRSGRAPGPARTLPY